MRVINLGILAHVDAGKTTTVEQMLYMSGNLRSLGSVDKGSTQTDFLAVERERGISVFSASVDLEIEKLRIRIIDTPGHMDFTGEVERSLSILDGAVLLVSAAEGIQSQTERFWKVLRQLNIPTIIFLNKIDRAGCNPEAVLDTLCSEFSPAIIAINRCKKPGEAEVSVEPCTFSEDTIFKLCENDKSLAERFLNEEDLSEQEIQSSFARQVGEALLFPLVYGASITGLGISELREAIMAYLPSNPLLAEGEPQGIVYKIEHDKNLGKVAHIRLYKGSLSKRDLVTLHRANAESFQEKITQIFKVSGSRREDIAKICGNEVAAVCGMAAAKVGDMVGQLHERKNIRMAEPLFTVQVYGEKGKERELLQAISELSDEDPLMSYAWNPDLREVLIHIMGKIQLEILAYLLLERYGLSVSFSLPSVIYKESPQKLGIGLERYTMPKPCWAIVKLQVEPLKRGSAYVYESKIGDSVLQRSYRNHIETAVQDALKQGRLGWEVTDLKVSLLDGESHIFHTHPLDFFLATPIALMKALDNAGSTLLEPLVKLKLTADEEFTGKLIGNILEMRGEFDSPHISKGKVEMEAIVPLSSSMDYPIQFSSLTAGRGTISSDFYAYKECPLELGSTAARRGIDPLDRDKWILHKRGAL